MLRLFLGSALLSALLFAAPAFQGVRTFIQNDGSGFQAQIKGDEYLNWVETKNGDILIYNKEDQNYDYAVITEGELKPSGKKYSNSGTTSLRRASSFQSLSKQKLYRLWRLKRQKGLND